MGRKEQSDHSEHPIGRNSRKRPSEVRTLAAEHPEHEATVNGLLDKGVELVLRRRRQTPPNVREHVAHVSGSHGDVRRVWLEPLVHHGVIAPEHAPVGKQITDAGGDFLTIVSPNADPDSPESEAVAELNEALEAERRIYAGERFVRDRPHQEKEGLVKIAGVALGAAAVATGFELGAGKIPDQFGAVKEVLQGIGTGVAGQTDDVLNAVAVTKTEDGGKKSKKQIFLENKRVWGAIGAAGGIDLAVPRLFELASLEARPLVSALYWLTATAGSIVVSAENYHRTKKAITELDKEGKLSQSIGLPEELKVMRRQPEFQKSLQEATKDDPQQERGTIRNLLTQQIDTSDISDEVKSAMHTSISNMTDEQLTAMQLLTKKERNSIARKEFMAHPYRKWLLGGLGVSLLASEAFGQAGLLEGNPLSGLIQSGIGPIETITAMIGLSKVDEKLYLLKRRYKLRKRRRAAEKAAKKQLPPAGDIFTG